MAVARNDRKINSLLQQMQQKTGLTAYKEKIESERKKQDDMSLLMKDLSKVDQRDPMRITRLANENNREEREKEGFRRERQNIMMRVNTRQRMRSERTYS